MSRGFNAFADSSPDTEWTGALGRVARDASQPTDIDLALARTAAADVLARGKKDTSQPWENAATGARGSVTPIAAAYSRDGKTCRDVLASYVNGNSESWMQSTACQSAHGAWDIGAFRPWRRT